MLQDFQHCFALEEWPCMMRVMTLCVLQGSDLQNNASWNWQVLYRQWGLMCTQCNRVPWNSWHSSLVHASRFPKLFCFGEMAKYDESYDTVYPAREWSTEQYLMKLTSALQTMRLDLHLMHQSDMKQLTEQSSACFKVSKTVLLWRNGQVWWELWHCVSCKGVIYRTMPHETDKCFTDNEAWSALNAPECHGTVDIAVLSMLQGFQKCFALEEWPSMMRVMTLCVLQGSDLQYNASWNWQVLYRQWGLICTQCTRVPWNSWHSSLVHASRFPTLFCFGGMAMYDESYDTVCPARKWSTVQCLMKLTNALQTMRLDLHSMHQSAMKQLT